MASRPQSRTRTRPATSARFRVGDCVTFRFGVGLVKGTIIEDRGEIGVEGVRLFTVRVRRTDSEDLITEVAADQLRAA